MITGANSGANTLRTLLGIMSGPIALLVFKLDRDVHTMFPVSHGQPSSGTLTSKRGLKFSSPWAIYRRLTENMNDHYHQRTQLKRFPQGEH